MIRDGIALLYDDYAVCEGDFFVDFYVNIDSPQNIRRWFRPQVDFSFDGFKPFVPLPRDQAFALFEWSLNWCVANHMHNYLIVHAGVVGKNGFGVVMPAPPGSGKSTLSAALAYSGWQLLSDELAMFGLGDDKMTSFPRPINLKNDSIDIMRKFVPGCVIGPVVKDTNKGTVAHLKTPSENLQTNVSRDVFPKLVVFPKYKKGVALSTARVSKGRGFMRLVDNAFNYQLLGATGFQKMLDVANDVTFVELEYSSLYDAVNWFNRMENDRLQDLGNKCQF